MADREPVSSGLPDEGSPDRTLAVSADAKPQAGT
jgi:hypothetical protein